MIRKNHKRIPREILREGTPKKMEKLLLGVALLFLLRPANARRVTQKEGSSVEDAIDLIYQQGGKDPIYSPRRRSKSLVPTHGKEAPVHPAMERLPLPPSDTTHGAKGMLAGDMGANESVGRKKRPRIVTKAQEQRFSDAIRRASVGAVPVETEEDAVREGLLLFENATNKGASLKEACVTFLNQYNGSQGECPSVLYICQRVLGVAQTGIYDAATKEASALNTQRHS